MATTTYVDPEALARIGSMELIAREVVEGFVSGRHRSPYHGFSVEYADHRAYTPGDEIRMLDWKLLARTNKYYVKLYEEETNLRGYILLDCSRSMSFRSEASKLSKLQFGSFLAAALSYLMVRQNDAVGMASFDHAIREYLPPRATPVHWRRILERLDQNAARDDTDVGSILHELAERIKRRGLIILISDLIDDVAGIVSGLQHFRHRHHEVIVFHVMDDAELTFPYDRLSRFKDIEGSARIVANPNSLRARYLARINEFIEKLRAECHERRISYNLANTKEPYDNFLAAYLDKRSRLG
jgi:uncharacterized protein (DUF58 family)